MERCAIWYAKIPKVIVNLSYLAFQLPPEKEFVVWVQRIKLIRLSLDLAEKLAINVLNRKPYEEKFR